MTAEKEPRTFTGAVGVADRRLALVSDDPRRIEAFRREHPGVREIDGTGKVLMPGLINTHCHVAMTLQRGYADDIALMKWLHEYIWPFEAQQTPDEIVLGAEMGIVEMLLGGVTTFVDMYWHENRIAEAVRRLGIRHLDTLGILDDRTIGAHCVHVDDGDIRILRERGVAVSHNPQSNMKISSGIAPIARMHSEGVLCTIGTDGTCSNNDLDMWDEMRTASFLQKVATMDPCVLPAYEILKMATVNAARAIGHAGELGVIKEGALADFILIDAVKPHLMPVYNMVANLIYCGKAADVDTVVVNGEIVVEGRRIEGVDLSNLCFQVQHTAEDIARRTAAAKK